MSYSLSLWEILIGVGAIVMGVVGAILVADYLMGGDYDD